MMRHEVKDFMRMCERLISLAMQTGELSEDECGVISFYLRPGTTGEDSASLHKILSAVRFVGFFELIYLHIPHIFGVRSLTN